MDESVVAALSSPGAVSLEGSRILLAEDGVDNQTLFRAHLTRAGAQLTTVDNGRDACAAALEAEAKGEPFSLVLMDMQMPILDGYAATASLRGKGYGRPIFALTAHAMAGDRERCLAAGCDDVLTKPIARDRLLAAVQGAMGQPRRGRPSRPASDAPPLRSLYEVDPEMHPLITEFVARLGGEVASIGAALARGDLAAATTTAHQLKGSAGGYGFPAVTEAARELELALRDRKDDATLRRRHEALAALARRVVPPSGPLA